MKKLFALLIAGLLIHVLSYSQPCFQPGALVSVRTTSSEKFDYIIFKFLKPHIDKGLLTGGSADQLMTGAQLKSSFHKIAFNYVTHLCDNKLSLVTTSKRLLQFKMQQKTDNMVVYGFELANGYKITSHNLKQHRDMYIVKIRIE
jgi:hypothetical protein